MVEVKVISIGDYIRNIDNIVSIPVMHLGEVHNVEVRIRKPMAEYHHKLMNLLAETFGDKLQQLAQRGDDNKDITKLSVEERRDVLLFSWLNSATLISSCCFYPDRNEDGTPISDPRIIWKSAEEVGSNCPQDLFNGINKYLEGIEIAKTVLDIEAKK